MTSLHTTYTGYPALQTTAFRLEVDRLQAAAAGKPGKVVAEPTEADTGSFRQGASALCQPRMNDNSRSSVGDQQEGSP